VSAAAAAASTFRLDVKGAEIRRALAAGGIRAVLIKGPAFARLLYPDPALREYTDVDLLVKPEAMRHAEKVLADQGFRRFDEEAPVRQTDPAVGEAVGVLGASHSVAWVRDRDSFVVDLHDSLPQVGVPENAVWRQITRHLDVLDVGGAPTEVLDRSATALLVALHAAHHGPGWSSAIRDLVAAVDTFELECWEAARELAATLKAETPLGVGLGLTASGRVIAERLSLPTEPSAAQRLVWMGAPWSASIILAFRDQPGLLNKALLLARILWPSPDALRRGSALARRGRRGVLAAYALRVFQIASRLPAAVRPRRVGSS
jgi:hypothetical protein